MADTMGSRTGLKGLDPTSIINKRKGEVSPSASPLMFPANLGVHCTLMRFFKYSYGGRKGSEVEGAIDIVLPLPKQIQDSFKINVAGDELGAINSGLAALAASPMSSKEFGASLTGSIAESAKDLVAGAGAAMGIAADSWTVLSKSLAKTSPDVANAVSAGRGTALNPFASLVFKGVDLKVHSLEWLLSPESESESETLKDVIKNLQGMVLPEAQGVGGTEGVSAIERSLLRYPHMVDIYFQGIDMTYYFKFKTSMVSQLSIDYTPNGLAVNKGGRPSAIRITMTLQEAFIHTADDYDVSESTSEELAEKSPSYGSGDGSLLYSEAASQSPSWTTPYDWTSAGGGTPSGDSSDSTLLAVGSADGKSVATPASSDVLEDEVLVRNVPFSRQFLYGQGITDEDIASDPITYSASSSQQGSV